MEEEKYIQLGENTNVLRLWIKDAKGNKTGEYLEFDLTDIELPLRYQELLDKDKRNRTNLKNQMVIIEKRQDVKGKGLLTKNEEDKIKAINNFFKEEIKVYNIFLGENGFEKLLNGNKITWDSLEEIDEIIEKQIVPYFNKSMAQIEKKIKEKYTINNKEEVLK